MCQKSCEQPNIDASNSPDYSVGAYENPSSFTVADTQTIHSKRKRYRYQSRIHQTSNNHSLPAQGFPFVLYTGGKIHGRFDSVTL